VVGGQPPRPLRADWLAICRRPADERWTRVPEEVFTLYLLTDAGERVASWDFDSLPLALAEGRVVAGEPAWVALRFEVRADQPLPWALVAAQEELWED
jgi:hypothetical protein